eukprot:scaffold32133_cov140-Isochrysis_galbana.AAC.4
MQRIAPRSRGAAVLKGAFAAHFSLAKSGELWPLAQASARSASQCAGPRQGVPQALARARNRTCIEPSSALDGRTRFEPGSGSLSSSIGCVKSCRGAIVRSFNRVRGVFLSQSAKGGSSLGLHTARPAQA